uniref:Single-pass membrane and coiled-coil domain-containing protein 4 n=1 Tax=Mus spicilegus TaxID=10103 RepID=A0A8C6H9H4_MUSSI
RTIGVCDHGVLGSTLPTDRPTDTELKPSQGFCVVHGEASALGRNYCLLELRITQVTLTGNQLTDISEAVVPEFEEKRSPAWTEECGPFSKPSLDISSQHPLTKMRQLKGKPKKETSKDKKERKQAMQEARQQVTTVVLPTLAVAVLLIVVFVYVATRPAVTE